MGRKEKPGNSKPTNRTLLLSMVRSPTTANGFAAVVLHDKNSAVHGVFLNVVQRHLIHIKIRWLQ